MAFLVKLFKHCMDALKCRQLDKKNNVNYRQKKARNTLNRENSFALLLHGAVQ